MSGLIRLIGGLIARRVEQGSLGASALGAAVGAVLGAALVWAIERARDAPIPVHPVTTGILGAFIGALVLPALTPRPAGQASKPFTRPRGAFGAVRVTNYNAALGRQVASVIVSVAVGGLIYFALVEQLGLSPVPAGVVGALVALVGAGILVSQPVLWVELTDSGVTFKRLFRTHTFPRELFRRWGFATTRGTVTEEIPSSPAPFVLELADGSYFEVMVSPAKASEIASVMPRPAGQTSAPGSGRSASPSGGPRR